MRRFVPGHRPPQGSASLPFVQAALRALVCWGRSVALACGAQRVALDPPFHGFAHAVRGRSLSRRQVALEHRSATRPSIGATPDFLLDRYAHRQEFWFSLAAFPPHACIDGPLRPIINVAWSPFLLGPCCCVV